MTVRKVLVEMELDPTEYMAGATVAGMDAEAKVEPQPLPDTQEAANVLVGEMFKGNVDICNSRIVGDLQLLFRGRAAPQQATHIDTLGAIIATAQEFHRVNPLKVLNGAVSVTCIPPQPGRPYYEVSFWSSPSQVIAIVPPPSLAGPDGSDI